MGIFQNWSLSRSGILPVFLFFYFIKGAILYGQEKETSELFLSLKKMDSLLFDEGFNGCNLELMENLVTDDLEFYHDTSGIQDKEEFLRATKDNICSGAGKRIIRKLVEGSLEVYPMKRNDSSLYGALQSGEHLFYVSQEGREAYLTGTAKFTSYWVLEQDEWKLKRVFSFDHRGISQESNKTN